MLVILAQKAPPESAPHFWSGCAFFEKGRAEAQPEARLGWFSRAEDEFRKAVDANPGGLLMSKLLLHTPYLRFTVWSVMRRFADQAALAFVHPVIRAAVYEDIPVHDRAHEPVRTHGADMPVVGDEQRTVGRGEQRVHRPYTGPDALRGARRGTHVAGRAARGKNGQRGE